MSAHLIKNARIQTHPGKGDKRPTGASGCRCADTQHEAEPVGAILERLLPDLLAGHDGDNLLAAYHLTYRKDITMTPRYEGPPGTFIVHLKPAPDPDDPEGHQRLRAALKRLWRSFGLRCIEVREDKGKA